MQGIKRTSICSKKVNSPVDIFGEFDLNNFRYDGVEPPDRISLNERHLLSKTVQSAQI